MTLESTEIVEEGWHRLHPLSTVVRLGAALIPILFILGPGLIDGGVSEAFGESLGPTIGAFMLFVFSVVTWLVTRWKIEGTSLRIETGLLRRTSLRFPLAQIQAIDTVRPFSARLLGLAELRVRTAGGEGESGRLSYLTVHEAEVVRAQLLALAHGLGEHTPAPPEDVLLSVPTPRLIASIALSGLGVIIVTGALLLITSIALFPDISISSVLGGSGAGLFALALALWARFNGEYKLTVADAPDGLRVRAGLTSTSAETIPRGRIQAVRKSEPLLWRPLHWCRLEVDVAGQQKSKGQGGAQMRAVLPVGSHADAQWLLDRIFPDAPMATSKPPKRAKYKTPLRYHFLAWARTDKCAVTTDGRINRITTWLPLTKVQSIRRVQGPLQRRFRLSTIHLDTAGRGVEAVLRERDAEEAEWLLDDLTVSCREARELGQSRAEHVGSESF